MPGCWPRKMKHDRRPWFPSMKKPVLYCIQFCLAAFFAACNIGPVGLPYTQAPKNYGWQWDDSVAVTAADGTRIKGNLFTPVGPDPDELFPAIIMPATWSLPETEYFAAARDFCMKGYIVLEYNARGWWGSTGLVNVAGPRDIDDVSSVIDWVCDNTAADPAKIGMCGISYGAGISLLGAAHDDRVKTVYSMCGWGDLHAALMPGDAVKSLWIQTMLIDTSSITFGDLDPEIRDLYADMKSHANLDVIDDYGAVRSVANQVDVLNGRGVSIGLSNNLQDYLFPLNTVLPFYEALTTVKRLDIHNGIHAFSNDCIGALGVPSQIWNTCHAWFDYHFKGVDTGIMDRKRISAAIKRTGSLVYLNDFSEDTAAEKLFLAPRKPGSYYGALSTARHDDADRNTIVSGADSGATIGLPVLGEIFEAHTPLQVTAYLPAISRSKAVIFMTDPFPATRHILGIPRVHLTVIPTSSRTQLIAYLYTVDELGVGTLFSHGPLSLWNAEPGAETDVSIDCFFTSVLVDRNHRLALVIDTEESEYYVRPTMEDYSITFTFNERSTISVPYYRDR